MSSGLREQKQNKKNSFSRAVLRGRYTGNFFFFSIFMELKPTFALFKEQIPLKGVNVGERKGVKLN